MRHKALTAALLDAVHLTPDESVPLLASEPSQAEQELAACREDIVSLIQAMHHENYWSCCMEKQSIAGFERFGDVALAFELPSIYQDVLEKRLKVWKLTVACCS